MAVTNWGGNVTFGARDVRYPSSEDELAHIVTTADRVRALGSGHSFNRIADTSGTLVSLATMPRVFEVAPDRKTVRVSAGLTLAELAPLLHDAGLALPTLPSLPHLTLTGAIVTATHGSGISIGSLATTVRAIRFVTATGQPAILTRRHRDFDGAVVSLGALGVTTELEIAVQPTFDVEQRVYDGLAWDALVGNLEPILSSAYGVSVFTAITGLSRVWVKQRVGDPATALPGVVPADGPQHPVRGLFGISPAELSTRYPRWADYRRLRHTFDPERRFANAMTDSYFPG